MLQKVKFILLMSVILISLLFCSCESTEVLKEAEGSTEIGKELEKEADDAMPENGSSEENMTTETEPEKYTDIVLSYKTDETVYENVIDKSYLEKEINITYPVLYTKPDKINALIEREAVSIFDLTYYGDSENLTLDIDYKISYMDEEIISIIFKGYGDRKYSNHPTYQFYTLNIDLVTGEKLVLSDIVDVDAVINDLNEKNYSFVMYETESVSERYYINDYVEFDALYSCDSGNFVYSYVTKDGIGLSIPVYHAIGDHKEVEIPIERKR